MRQSDIREEERSLNLLLIVVLGIAVVIIPVLERIKFATGFLVFLVAALTVFLFVERLNRRAARAELEDLEVSFPVDTEQEVSS